MKTSRDDFLLESLRKYPYNFTAENISQLLINLRRSQATELMTIVERGFHLNVEVLPFYFQLSALLRQGEDSATTNNLTSIKKNLSNLFSDLYNTIYIFSNGEDFCFSFARYAIDLIYENKKISNSGRLLLFDHLLSQSIFDNWTYPSYCLNYAARFFYIQKMMTDAQRHLQWARDDIQRQINKTTTEPSPTLAKPPC